MYINPDSEETKVESLAYKEGFKNIADISKERIKRAAKKIKKRIQCFLVI